jgi:two-component system OmpR family response regulator
MNLIGDNMNPMGTILIVDDEAAVLHFFQKALQRAGFQVTSAASGEAALEWIGQQEFDLALLDLQLQNMSGLDIMEQLQKQWPATPVIIITAHASLETAVKALRQGVHDYLIKPCSIDELQNSVRAGMLRRQQELQRRALAVHSQAESTATPQPKARSTSWSASTSSAEQPALAKGQEQFLRSQDLVVDCIRHIARVGNATLDLSPVEFSLLAYLVRESPRVVSAEELAGEIWGSVDVSREAADTLRSHIYHIRLKIRAKADREIIRTVRGVGYVVDDELTF